MLETLEEVAVKEKHHGSSFLALHVCNSQNEWLILSFGIDSNLFKLLWIEVIFKYNILFLIGDWYFHFIYNACFYDLDP